jgi:hypothetical protein
MARLSLSLLELLLIFQISFCRLFEIWQPSVKVCLSSNRCAHSRFRDLIIFKSDNKHLVLSVIIRHEFWDTVFGKGNVEFQGQCSL